MNTFKVEFTSHTTNLIGDVTAATPEQAIEHAAKAWGVGAASGKWSARPKWLHDLVASVF